MASLRKRIEVKKRKISKKEKKLKDYMKKNQGLEYVYKMI
jgi:hypothetical protein